MTRIHKLTLTTGEVALVDLSDEALVREYRWHRGGTDNRYAVSKIDGNTLDCRKVNLRFVSHSQNCSNRHVTNNPFGYRGVAYFPKKKKYQARVQRDRLSYRGPYRDNPEDAAQDFDDMARGLHGEYATYNFPRPGERQVKPRRVV